MTFPYLVAWAIGDMSQQDQYRLVIFEPIEDLTKARDIACAATGVHPTDAIQWLAKAPGVWPWPLNQKSTEQFLDGLYQLKIAAEARRTDKFPVLSPVKHVREAISMPDGLKILGLQGEATHWIPWDKIELLSYGRIHREDEFLPPEPPSIVSAIQAGMRLLKRRVSLPERKRRSTRIPREPLSMLHIVRQQPQLCLKLVEGQTHFQVTGIQKTDLPSTQFLKFLKSLAAQADEAYLTRLTRVAIGFEPETNPNDSLFDTEQQLLDYTTHRLLWSWYRKDRQNFGDTLQ